MENLFKTCNKKKGLCVLVVFMILFIVLDIQVPKPIGDVVDTIFGRVVVIMVAGSLLFSHPVLGVLSLIVAYELIHRSEKSTGSFQLRKYFPSQVNKDKHLNALNQFPVTLEEEMVHKMVPFVSSGSSSPSSYKPTLDKLHDAAKL